MDNFEANREAILAAFKNADELGQEVLFQDETGFSKVSYKRKTFSKSAQDMVID